MPEYPQIDGSVPALLHAALERHAAGRAAEALPLYRRVLAFEPDNDRALGMLALILADGRDDEASEAMLQRHLALKPNAGASLHALGRLKARQGRDAAALPWLEQAAQALPRLAPTHNDVGACLHRLGRVGEALTALDRAVALDSAYAVAHANRGLVLLEAGRAEEALQALTTALIHAPAEAAGLRASILHQLAKAARAAGRPAEAETALRAELTTSVDNPEIGGQLAAVLEQAGRAPEALAVRNDLARRAGLGRAGKVDRPAARILLLGAAGGGHTPTRYLVDPDTFATLSLTLLSPDQPDAPLGAVDAAALAEVDLVFSTLGDVDHDGGQFAQASALCERLGKPVINPPRAIARTGRDQAAALFADLEGMVTPKVQRLSPQALAATAIAQPMLARPAGDHGGDNLVLLQDEADKAAFLKATHASELLLTEFVDFRSPDGYWRKYRLIFVDRRVFPYHLAIGEHWLTHYWRAEMGRAAWKMAEEERFLADWRGVFGERAASAAEAAALRLDLDYGGMDCALTARGDLLLFEANACVLLHLDEPIGQFPYKHRHVPPIREAFTRMALERARGGG